MDQITFGHLVSQTRKAWGLTLSEVGRRIGVDHARMSRIERGLVKPTAREVDGLVRALALNPSDALALAAEVNPA